MCELDLFQSLFMLSQGPQLTCESSNLFAVEMNVLKFLWALWLACGGGVSASNPFVIVGHNLGWSLCRWSCHNIFMILLPMTGVRGLAHLCVFHEVAEFNPPLHLLPRAVKRGNWNITGLHVFKRTGISTSCLWYKHGLLGLGCKGHTFSWSWRTF